MTKKIPELRIALNYECTLKCNYCPPQGENFIGTKNIMRRGKLLEIISAFYDIGLRKIGFTGGEPLLSKNLPFIIRGCSDFNKAYLKLYTNGVLLSQNEKILKRIDMVKISLDTVNRKRFLEITGKDRLGDVLQGIHMAREDNIKIRINTVLSKYNYNDMTELMDFCRFNEINLKILDMNCFEAPGYLFWKKAYRSPQGIASSLECRGLKKRIIYTTGNYGIPMSEYSWGKISIRIKDTSNASVYSPVCKSCGYFPCQEGLYHLTLTCNGHLKICRHRPDIYKDLSSKNKFEIKNNILDFLSSHYFTARRLSCAKQVFFGHFGKNGK
ncbi:MAG: radical SAM protein [Candidatus Omnitrophica bacterium]|nr:radical SAM protein [Candidatus Omnitrophota bacterium]